MAELLPERLTAYTSDDDHTKASKSKIKPVTNILDWIQAFWFVCCHHFTQTTSKGARSHWIPGLDY